MGLPRTTALISVVGICWLLPAARAADEDEGLNLERFATLDLADGFDGGGADLPAQAPPAEAKPVEIKSPTVKKMMEKGYLTPEEAAQLDKEEEARRGTLVSSIAERLKFSGLTYFGYTYQIPGAGNNTGDFELRRNYITLEAQLTKNISFRNTLDIIKETGASTGTNTGGDNAAEEGSEGTLKFRVKYAYLYINEILPYSALEFGVVHRPWVDWEEHHGWWYRSVVQTFIENSDSAGVITSADLGANLKTAVPYFSSEVAVVNGESYDHLNRIGGPDFNNSVEGRFTIHALATGKVKVNPVKDSYLDVSFNTVNNFRYNSGAPASVLGSRASANGEVDRLIYQFHAVLNVPLFLIAGQFVYNQDRFQNAGVLAGNRKDNQDNTGVSVNAEFRPLFLFPELCPKQTDKWAIFGRGDYWNIDTQHGEREFYVYGVSYDLNRYVRLIVNGINVDKNANVNDVAKAMFTAEVNW